MESVLQPYQSRCHSEFQPGCPFVKPTEVCSVEERKARRTLEEQSAHVYAHGDLIYQDDKRGSISWNCQLPYYVHEWVMLGGSTAVADRLWLAQARIQRRLPLPQQQVPRHELAPIARPSFARRSRFLHARLL